MKKLLTIMLGIILSFSALLAVGCGPEEPDEPAVTGNVSVKYYATAKELLPMMISGTETIGLLPEPAATNLEAKTAQQGITWYRLNVQELYDAQSKAFPQAVLMIKSDLLNAHPELATKIANSMNDGVTWVKENIATAQQVIKAKYENTAVANMNVNAVSNSNIQFKSDVKESVKAYLNEIISLDASGAKQVEDDFFYTATEASGKIERNIKVYAPDGAPALSIAKYINDGETFGLENKFEYNIIDAKQLAGCNGDIVIMPVNLASKIYKNEANKTNPYKMVGVVTHGNLYIMSREEIKVSDLKDKQIASIQQGQVPDWTLKMVLLKNNLTVLEVN